MMLDFEKAVKLLKKYGISFADWKLVKKREEVPKAAKKLGFPLVAKLISPQIIHKSEGGFVETNIENEADAIRVFDGFIKKAKLVGVSGVLFQKKLAGNEIILGGKRDAQFGPVVLFGLGGIFTEILKDASIRIAPISEKDAYEMIHEIKGHLILEGARGRGAINKRKLAKTIVSASRLVTNEKIKEFDLNPCFTGNDCIAADVRIMA